VRTWFANGLAGACGKAKKLVSSCHVASGANGLERQGFGDCFGDSISVVRETSFLVDLSTTQARLCTGDTPSQWVSWEVVLTG